MIHALRYTEELEKVGFSTEQAKKSVQVWMDLMDQNFATKSDLKEYYFMTKSELKDVQVEIKNLEQKLTIRLGAMIGAGIAILAALNNFK